MPNQINRLIPHNGWCKNAINSQGLENNSRDGHATASNKYGSKFNQPLRDNVVKIPSGASKDKGDGKYAKEYDAN
ncbi:hypothetical protein VspSTUT11_31290 [Vibrio sp. STUT-A11]|nr:hypothetical protein VspSTUT11_31290 [Vibrio sp. STUT-A11]